MRKIQSIKQSINRLLFNQILNTWKNRHSFFYVLTMGLYRFIFLLYSTSSIILEYLHWKKIKWKKQAFFIDLYILTMGLYRFIFLLYSTTSIILLYLHKKNEVKKQAFLLLYINHGFFLVYFSSLYDHGYYTLIFTMKKIIKWKKHAFLFLYINHGIL